LPIPTYFIHVCVSTTIHPFDSNAQWKKIGIQKIFKNTTGGHSSQRFLNKKIKHTIYSTAMHHPNNYQKLLYLAFHSPPFIFSLAHAPSKNHQKSPKEHQADPAMAIINQAHHNNLAPTLSQHNSSKAKPQNSSTPLTCNKQTLTHIDT
jgi:hypothetical protein